VIFRSWKMVDADSGVEPDFEGYEPSVTPVH